MNEKVKIYIVFVVIVALIGVVIGYNITISNKSKKVYDEFIVNLNKEEENIVFIGREGCQWCQLFRPIFDYYADKYKISYSYIDTDTLVSKDFNKILDKLEISEDDFGTPLVAFVQNGEIKETISGYVDESELLDILKEQGFVSKDETIALNYLDFASFKKVVKSKQKSVIVVGQKYCTFCIRFKPILMSVADNKNAEIYYINYDAIEEQAELKEYVSQFEEFQGDWGTPLTIVVEKGKIIDSLSGYASEENFIKFLQKNELLGE